MAYVGWSGMPHGMSGALKAWIGRRKYGKKNFQKRAAKGQSMKGQPVASAEEQASALSKR